MERCAQASSESELRNECLKVEEKSEENHEAKLIGTIRKIREGVIIVHNQTFPACFTGSECTPISFTAMRLINQVHCLVLTCCIFMRLYPPRHQHCLSSP